MKLSLYILLLLYVPINVYSQVGINTQTPLGVFHIDGKSDNAATPTTLQLANDIIISTNGFIGIGTMPTASVHIKSTTAGKGFRLEDGSEYQDKVLMSDENGFATWKMLSAGSRFAAFTMQHPAYIFSGATQIFSASTAANASFSSMIKGASHTVNSITLPQGNYILFVQGVPINLTLQPYFSIQLVGTYASGGTVSSSVYKGEPTLSAADFFQFSDKVTLQAQIQLFNASNNVNTALVTPLDPPNNFGLKVSITALKLNF